MWVDFILGKMFQNKSKTVDTDLNMGVLKQVFLEWEKT